MNPYRTASPPPEAPEEKTPAKTIESPRELDMVRVIKNPSYVPDHLSRVGSIGWVSIISDEIYLVTFIKNRKTTCGFFHFPDEIEIVKRAKSNDV